MNNIYKLLNSVTTNLDEYYPSKLTDLEKERWKQNFRKSINSMTRIRRRKTAAIAAVVLGTAIITTPFIGNKVYASINQIGISIEQFINHKVGSLQDYKTVVDQTVTQAGVSASLNEFAFDDDQLLISTTFSSDKVKWDGPASMVAPSAIYINGKNILASGLSGASKADKINSSTYGFLNTVAYDSTNLKGNIHVKIVYSNVENVTGGNWTFDFIASRDELAKNTKVIPVNRIITLDNGLKGKIDSLKLSPISTNLHYEMSSNDQYHDLTFIITDQSGNDLKMVSGTGLGQNGKGTWGVDTLDKSVTKLKITPVFVTYHYPKTSGEVTETREVLKDQTFEVNIK